MAKKSVPGDEAFELFYSDLFGDRWPILRKSLCAPVRQVARDSGLLKPYYLDAGSVEAALSLPPAESGNILDMCAAPGGKTLILASRLDANSVLTANEFSRDRKNRLLSVLDLHLPEETRKKISVTGRDASRWSRYEQDAYDRILLDAPCSSERHVLSAPAHLLEWSPARIRNLAQRQWSLLSGAWLVLKNGGFLLYSTCALSGQENDGVVDRLLKKYPDAVLANPDRTGFEAGYRFLAEKTQYGYHILPDTADGAGPIYYSLIEKKGSTLS